DRRHRRPARFDRSGSRPARSWWCAGLERGRHARPRALRRSAGLGGARDRAADAGKPPQPDRHAGVMQSAADSRAGRRRSLMKLVPEPATVKSALSAHAAIGLLAGALLYLVCLSGTVLVLYQEWQRFEQPDAPEMTAIDP